MQAAALSAKQPTPSKMTSYPGGVRLGRKLLLRILAGENGEGGSDEEANDETKESLSYNINSILFSNNLRWTLIYCFTFLHHLN